MLFTKFSSYSQVASCVRDEKVFYIRLEQLIRGPTLQDIDERPAAVNPSDCKT